MNTHAHDRYVRTLSRASALRLPAVTTAMAVMFTIAMLCVAPAARAVTVYDANAAFVDNEKPDGTETNPFGPFSVGHSPTFGGFTAFTAAQHTDSALGVNEPVEGYSIPNNVFVPGALVNTDAAPYNTNFGVTLAPSQILLHPGNPGGNGLVPPFNNGILRFTAPTSGSYVIAGDWQSLSTGATVNSVLHNGSPLVSSALDNSSFNLTHTLLAGETIDFVVNDGGDGIGSDSTGLRATLTLQNHPAYGTMYRAGADLRVFELANNGSPVAPINGPWRYGTSDSLGSTFNPFAATEHADAFPPETNPGSFQGWFEPGGDVVPIVAVNVTGVAQGSCCGTFDADQIWVHPEPDGSLRTFDIVRWVAPADGTIDLTATWVQKHSAAATVHVLLNGVPGLFDGSATPGAGTTFATTFAVSAGDTIDFAVGPNPQTGYGATSTGFDAKITYFPPVPEPATLAMLSLAAAAVGGRRLRKRA